MFFSVFDSLTRKTTTKPLKIALKDATNATVLIPNFSNIGERNRGAEAYPKNLAELNKDVEVPRISGITSTERVNKEDQICAVPIPKIKKSTMSNSKIFLSEIDSIKRVMATIEYPITAAARRPRKSAILPAIGDDIIPAIPAEEIITPIEASVNPKLESSADMNDIAPIYEKKVIKPHNIRYSTFLFFAVSNSFLPTSFKAKEPLNSNPAKDIEKSTITTIPKDANMKNAKRQSMIATVPATRGPRAIPAVVDAPRTPIALPLDLVGTISPKIAVITGLTNAKPIPCTNRPDRKSSKLVENAQIIAPIEYEEKPKKNAPLLFISDRAPENI